MFAIQSAAQLRVLNSPIRMAAFAALRELGPSTAPELAARAGIRSEAMHYHLRELERIGLVRQKGQRATGRRPQVLFEAVADRLRLPAEASTPSFQREKARGCRLLLRRTERDVSAGITSMRAGERPLVRTRVTRDVVRLSAKDLAQLHARLDAIDAWLMGLDASSKPHRISISMVVAPVTD